MKLPLMLSAFNSKLIELDISHPNKPRLTRK